MYSERVDPYDVLDGEELASYLRGRSACTCENGIADQDCPHHGEEA